MRKRRSRFAPSISFELENLESRVVLSGIASSVPVAPGTAQIGAIAARPAPTQTTLAVSAGTLGQPITFTVTVRAPASAGSPVGTVNIVDHGQVIETVALSPLSASSGKYDVSAGTATLTPQPGGSAEFIGKHAVSAVFVPSGAFARSIGNKTFTVAEPNYTTLAGGVKIATIAPGTGPQIQSGQTASVLYTGYLAKNGKIFDDSINHGGTPLSYTLGSGMVIPGFDAATVGMKAGETRIVEIPPSQGYGSAASGAIPANSTLIFVLTLESIS